MTLKYLIIGMLLTSVSAASAHDAKGSHGGRITDAGPYHLEMVVQADTIDVFISDQNEKAIAASGFKATAIVVAGGKSHRVLLLPVDGSRLSGKATAALSTEAKGIVQLTAPDGKTAQAKFD